MFYELTYLISPDLQEQDLKKVSEEVKELIIREGGVSKKETGPVKRKLGYPINKKEGTFLISLNFELSPEKLEKLEKNLKSEQKIFRYIILARVSPEKIKKAFPKKVFQKMPLNEFSAEKEIPKTSKKFPEDKKIELKEIDKKIEEILKE